MRIAVVGVGAVGGYFGGRLALAGSDVVFIARGTTLDALRKGPLRVESVNGDFEVAAKVTDQPEETGAVHVVMVAVKSWQVSAAASAIRSMIGPTTIVVPLQNGIEAPDQLAAILDQRHVAGGLCRIIAFVIAPGHIRHAGAEPSIAFGPLVSEQRHQLEGLRKEFIRAGVVCEIPGNIRAAMWEKLLFIGPYSGMAAVTRTPAGTLRRDFRQQLAQAMEEVIAVASACGVPLPAEAIARTFGYVDGLPENGTSSMQRDIAAGRPSELEAQIGAIIRLGRHKRIATPRHDAIYTALEPLERRARERTTQAVQVA